MATPRKIQLNPKHRPVFAVDNLTSASAAKASELLQQNHERHNTFFNEDGFHNHIAHHLLTLYALGATPSELQKGYVVNASYQMPLPRYNDETVKSMQDHAKYKEHLNNNPQLGLDKNYANFLEFFTREIETKGHEAVLNEYVFSGDERAEDMFVRLHAGFLHPLIHLGFALEFDQPALIAEALAQTAVHDTWMGQFLHGAEKAAKAIDNTESRTLVSILEEIRKVTNLVNSPHWEDSNKVRDGILKRAPEEMINHASRYRVADATQLPTKTAEMMNFAVYFTIAAQHPPHEPKMDFFYMHCANSSIFFPKLMSLPYVSDENKIRLLEWKCRTDLALYVSRGSPPLLIEEITNFKPRDHAQDRWPEWFSRITAMEDDGHASKLIRAIAAASQETSKGDLSSKSTSDGFVMDNSAFDKAAQMVVQSVHTSGPIWVRNCGFDEAWKDVPIRGDNRDQKI